MAVFAAALLSGCAVGPDFAPPPPPHADSYGSGAPNVALGKPTDSAWWRQFHAPALDGLIEMGLNASPTLESARQTLLQSEDEARAGAGVFYPQLDAAFDVSRQRSAPVRLGGAGAPQTFSLYTLTGAISYAVDLFGGERRKVEALRAAADERRLQVGSAYLLLTGGVADAAIARAGYAEEAATLAEIVALDTAQKQLVEAQVEAGHAPFAATLQADQQLAADQQSLAVARQRESAASHLVGALIGREPGEGLPPAPGLADFALPATIPVSLPSQLVRQRPDILEAEAAMHEASAEVGVATAALFPSISITGDYGAAATGLSRLGGPAGQFWSIGPTVDVPLFQGGGLLFQRRAAQAGLRKAQTDYRQAVLGALQQVADSLKALDADSEMVGTSGRADAAASAQSGLTATNRDAGLVADADVIAARIQAGRTRLVLIAARAQQLQDVVALYLATGGGWTGRDGEGGLAVAKAR